MTTMMMMMRISKFLIFFHSSFLLYITRSAFNHRNTEQKREKERELEKNAYKISYICCEFDE